ncbi:hypothetical protein B296_00021308, partial [Ensete ventricosum]
RPHRDPSAAAPAASSFHAKPPLALGLNRDGPSAPVVGSQGEGFKREMRDLEELLSKLNPMAEEFVPPSLAGMENRYGAAGGGLYASGFEVSNGVGDGGAVGNGGRRVRVVDCRMCGDPNTVLRFAFIEFTDEGKSFLHT